MTSDRNPTDALNQALSEQRMDGAEKSALEVISRAMDMPIEVVYRVIYAFVSLQRTAWVATPDDHNDWAELIEDDEVRQAIRELMDKGAKRVMLRKAIERGMALSIPTEKLIAPEDAVRICDGCAIRLECAAQSLHTYDKCYDGRLSMSSVVPLRMYKGKVDVEANQPKGRYTLPIEAFATKRY